MRLALRSTLLASALAAALPAVPALADNFVWVNAAGGFWDDPDNWFSGQANPGIPGVADRIFVKPASRATVTMRQLPGTSVPPLSEYFAASVDVDTPFVLAGGQLLVTGDSLFRDSVTWTGGGFSVTPGFGSGTWTFKKGLQIQGLGLAPMNGNAVVLEGASVLDNAGLLWQAATTIAQGATVEMRGSRTVNFLGGLDLRGTIDRTVAGQADDEALLGFSGAGLAGTVRNRAGTLRLLQQSRGFGSPETVHTGTFVVDAGAVLQFEGTQTVQGTIQGDGAVRFVAGTTTLDAATFLVTGAVSASGGAFVHWLGNGTLQSLDAAGGNFTLDGELVGAGAAKIDGLTVAGTPTSVIRFQSGATVSGVYVQSGGTAEFGGVTTVSGSGNLGAGEDGRLKVLAGGRLQLEGTGIMSGGGQLSNLGQIQRNTVAGKFTLGLDTQNDGVVSVQAGTLAVDRSVTISNRNVVEVSTGATLDFSGGSYVQTQGTTQVDGEFLAKSVRIEGGTLTGSGVIRNEGSDAQVFVDGLLTPGGDGAGMFTVQGDVTFGENAILDVVLGPTPQETDLLVVNGHASFAGVLRFRFADGYVPPVGLAFGVVLHQTRGVNDFTLLPVGNAAALADVRYQLLTEDELVSIQVVSAAPIPEPAEWMLLLAGGGVLLLRGRQGRR